MINNQIKKNKIRNKLNNINKNNLNYKNLINYNNNTDMIYKKKSYDTKLIYNDDEPPNNKLLKNFFKHKCKTKQNLINVIQKRDYNKTEYFSSLKLMKVSDINYKRISDSINLNKRIDYKINKEGKNFNESGCINRNEKNKNIIYQYKNFENKKTRKYI